MEDLFFIKYCLHAAIVPLNSRTIVFCYVTVFAARTMAEVFNVQWKVLLYKANFPVWSGYFG